MYEISFWNDTSYFESESCHGKLHRSSPSFFGFWNNSNVTFWSLRRNWPLTLPPSKCWFPRQKAGTSSKNLWNQKHMGETKKKLEINQPLKGRSFCFRFRWGARLELSYPMKVAGGGVGCGILVVYGWEKEEISMDVLKERGRWECEGKILKDAYQRKEVPNIFCGRFLFVIFFCDFRSQGLKILVRIAYGWRMTMAGSSQHVPGQIPMVPQSMVFREGHCCIGKPELAGIF